MADSVLERVNVTADGGVVKEIYQRGEEGVVPSAGDEITGSLPNACSILECAAPRNLRGLYAVFHALLRLQLTTLEHLKMVPSLTVRETVERRSRCV